MLHYSACSPLQDFLQKAMILAMHVQYAFIDSGIGGLPYLEHLREREKNAQAVYVADTANFPYGTKTTAELQEIAIRTVQKIIERFQPELIIVACNTLSVAALDVLRKQFALPYVGTVPAVKVAAEKTKLDKIVLIASEKSVGDAYTANLIKKFSSPERFILKAEQDLIHKIEHGLLFASEVEKDQAVKPVIDFCVSEGADCLVLACTHFLIIEDAFKRVSAGRVNIIESLNGVTEQILRVVPVANAECNAECKENESFLFVTKAETKAENERYQKVAERYRLQFGGVL